MRVSGLDSWPVQDQISNLIKSQLAKDPIKLISLKIWASRRVGRTVEVRMFSPAFVWAPKKNSCLTIETQLKGVSLLESEPAISMPTRALFTLLGG